MAWIALGVVALGVATALMLAAFNRNLVFFFTPSQVAAHEAPTGRTFRIGGMVVPGSLKREGVEVRFVVTDTAKTIPVGTEPHGLTIWPQPGRYSLGHTGVFR
jgi:cytochrome c-type biogenesis protein CcmE